jgi:serine phosphatase RsbU (regulator of sigma subunit)
MVVWRAHRPLRAGRDARDLGGALHDIRMATEDSELTLAEGDLLVLYTDGVAEARDVGGEVFGIERLCAVVERSAHEPPPVIRRALTRGSA